MSGQISKFTFNGEKVDEVVQNMISIPGISTTDRPPGCLIYYSIKSPHPNN